MRRFLRTALINIGFVLLGVVALELLFGSWLHPNLLNRLNISKNYQRTYDIDGLYDWDPPTSTYTRDAFGLRGSFSSPEEIDILTVGGSTTDQVYITDGYTWQDVMQVEFAKEGKNVVVANAGVDGQSSYGHIKNFDWWFPQITGLAPRYILFYVGINDFYRNVDNRYDGLLRQQDDALTQAIRERSAIYHLIRTVKGVYRAQFLDRIGHGAIDVDALEWTDQPIMQDHKVLMSARLDAYAQRLQVLLERTEAIGAVPVFVTQPTRRYKLQNGRIVGLNEMNDYEGKKYNGVDYHAMMRHLDAVTMNACEGNGAICIDLAAGIAADLEDDDFYDPFHMTPKGARKVGLFLHDALSRYVE